MFDLANETHFSLNVEGLESTGLEVISFEGKESISEPYSFEINLINSFVRLDITKLLSKPAYLAFTPDNKNGVHGTIQSVKRGAVGGEYAEFSIMLTPRFTHLEKRTNQRIFQHKTVPQIITQILNEFGIVEGAQHEFRLKETYPERDYCVQYDESDAYFIQRLCEEEGIHYHFEHTANNHMMVFGDNQPIFPTLAEAIRYASDTGFVAEDPIIKAFDVSVTSKTKRSMWRDYNYTNTKIPEGQAEGTQSAKANGAIEPDLEYYDYPGHFMDNARGKHLAQIQIERLRTEQVLAEGYGDVPTLHTGYYLNLEQHPSLDAKDPWLINTVYHQGKQPQVIQEYGGEQAAKLKNKIDNIDPDFSEQEFHQGYRNKFTATPKDVVWRPPLAHPKPKILGSQTAKVVGPAGEEIYCNEYGSVKVQFNWDREGKFDENSSCWVRVGSSWAHKGYGTFTIPRIGMEAVISFLEGDPDQPMITGCVNNGTNTQAEGMPANKTKTGFKTNSSPGGGGFNEFTLEDKAGQEQIFLHAQKDMNAIVKHDLTESIENNMSTVVAKEKTTVVGEGSRSSIAMDGENIVLQVGESKIVITKDEIFIHGNTHIHQTAAETINLEASKDITLNCGAASDPPKVPVSENARTGGK